MLPGLSLRKFIAYVVNNQFPNKVNPGLNPGLLLHVCNDNIAKDVKTSVNININNPTRDSTNLDDLHLQIRDQFLKPVFH